MPYVVETTTEEDFPALIEAVYYAFQRPKFDIYVFFPPEKEAAIQRELKDFKEGAGEVVWIEVYDSDDPEKRIVGGAKWCFFQRSPHVPRPGQEETFVHPSKQETDWYPEGSVLREFSTQVQQQHNAPRIQWTEGRPHCYLNVAFTIPEHRRRGVAGKFLEWGLQKADELNLECYLEASTLGAPVYRRYGFLDGPVALAEPKMPEGYTDEQKAEWEQYQKNQLPSASLEMWRPVKGELTSISRSIQYPMKVVPFPLSLNIGSDIVHLPRVSRLFTGRYRDRFMRRILCEQELLDFQQRFRQSLEPSSALQAKELELTKTRWLAGRFAAKEAARKAAPSGASSLGWKDVWVRIDDTSSDANSFGRPEVVYLKGYDLQKGSVPQTAQAGKLTVAHDGEYVVATVLAAAQD
ncbi:hypothetical protein KEM56_005678 [Ascosphaera pollenicola]|nr:hypothetical protein KEM56_005678 [Ascosphaera pollenicola]